MRRYPSRFHDELRTATGHGLGQVFRGALWVGAILALPVSPVTGQDQPSPTAADYKRVAAACHADYTRFCRHDADTIESARLQAICLKNFKADLSLGCRHAVNAVTR
ncbi:MAG: hypothetical protein JO001_27920 [Alphaproteobacteria bacterium]|nr:hypothetical protein [Alphaproteobacteria bacterium]